MEQKEWNCHPQINFQSILFFWTLYSSFGLYIHLFLKYWKTKKYEFAQKYQAAKTVFNIDNNNKCFLSAKTLPSHKYISFKIYLNMKQLF